MNTSIATYNQKVKSLVESYPKELPKNVYGPNGKEASWNDLVWYIKDSNTQVKHRYIFTKPKENSKRLYGDETLSKGLLDKSELFDYDYERLLKIYTLYVQSLNIVNTSKQYRATTAAKVLLKATHYPSLNDLTFNDWSSVYRSSFFWDFCTEKALIKKRRRPRHADRSRYIEDVYERNSKKSKETPDDLIIASGVIYNEIFKVVNEDGTVKPRHNVDLKDAITITVVLLGLASPNRTNSEVPLLPNQTLKSVCTTTGKTVYYLDWPGSKGFQDNLNHVLSVVAPQVSKAIHFFNKLFQPERILVRYIKNKNIKWSQLLAGFKIDSKRAKKLDFKRPPNLFTVGYAIGLYKLNDTIPVLKNRSSIVHTNTRKKWRFSKKTNEKLVDCFISVPVHKIEGHHLIVTGFTDYIGVNGLFSLLLITNINQNRYRGLNLKKVETVSSLEETVIKHQMRHIPSFPMGYASTDSGIDLEHALFCISPCKHGLRASQGIGSSPYSLLSPAQVKNIFSYHLSCSNTLKNRSKNLFEKYGFGTRALKLHSLRHFANTNAEKGGVPISVISVWSGRKDATQTLEYVHTSEEEKSDRVVSTLGFDNEEIDIRVITKNELKAGGLLPASVTDFGVCLQDLSVSPCNYLSDFLSGCFECENAAYVCGDKKAIEVLELDFKFQRRRLTHMSDNKSPDVSHAAQSWFNKHTKSVEILRQLINLMKTEKVGSLIRFSQSDSEFYVTDIKSRSLTRIPISLPSPDSTCDHLTSQEDTNRSIPEEMQPLLEVYGIGNSKDN